MRDQERVKEPETKKQRNKKTKKQRQRKRKREAATARWIMNFEGRQPLIEDDLFWKITFNEMEDNLFWKMSFDDL